MRIRTGIHPGDWTENEPAEAVHHWPAGYMARQASNVGAMTPTVLVQHLRTPETASSKAARLRREQRQECGKFLKRQGEYCARITGHLGFCRTRWALDNAARKKASGVEA